MARLESSLSQGGPIIPAKKPAEIFERAAEVLKAVPVAVSAALREYSKPPKRSKAKKTKRAAKPKAARPARKRSKAKPKA